MPVPKVDLMNTYFSKGKLSEGSDDASVALFPHYHKDGEVG